MSLSSAPRILALVATVTALLFTLSACKTIEYVDRPVEVLVPVTEPCIDQIPEEPVYETERLLPGDSIGLVGQAYRIERKQRESYVCDLFAELSGCTEEKFEIPSYCLAEGIGRNERKSNAEAE